MEDHQRRAKPPSSLRLRVCERENQTRSAAAPEPIRSKSNPSTPGGLRDGSPLRLFQEINPRLALGVYTEPRTPAEIKPRKYTNPYLEFEPYREQVEPEEGPCLDPGIEERDSLLHQREGSLSRNHSRLEREGSSARNLSRLEREGSSVRHLSRLEREGSSARNLNRIEREGSSARKLSRLEREGSSARNLSRLEREGSSVRNLSRLEREGSSARNLSRLEREGSSARNLSRLEREGSSVRNLCRLQSNSSNQQSSNSNLYSSSTHLDALSSSSRLNQRSYSRVNSLDPSRGSPTAHRRHHSPARRSSSREPKPTVNLRSFKRSESLLSFIPTVQRSCSLNEHSPRAVPRRGSLRVGRLLSRERKPEGATTHQNTEDERSNLSSADPADAAGWRAANKPTAAGGGEAGRQERPGVAGEGRQDRSIFPNFESLKGVLFGESKGSAQANYRGYESNYKRGNILNQDRRRKSGTPVKDEFTEFSQYGSRFTLNQLEEKVKEKQDGTRNREQGLHEGTRNKEHSWQDETRNRDGARNKECTHDKENFGSKFEEDPTSVPALNTEPVALPRRHPVAAKPPLRPATLQGGVHEGGVAGASKLAGVDLTPAGPSKGVPSGPSKVAPGVSVEVVHPSARETIQPPPREKSLKQSVSAKLRLTAKQTMADKLRLAEKLRFLQKSKYSADLPSPTGGGDSRLTSPQQTPGSVKLTGGIARSDSDSGYGDFIAVPENRIKQVDVEVGYDLIQKIGEGWISKVYLAENRLTRSEVVLKAINANLVTAEEFYREYQHTVLLSTHRNILRVFDCFQTDGFFVYSTEYAPLGDLRSNISETGLGEMYTKRVATQIGDALQFIHSKKLCHLNVKLENILVFSTDFSTLKLCDFGSVKPFDDIIVKKNEHLPYCPPELVAKHANEYYQVDRVQDVFQFGIVVFFCLLGTLPWQKADTTDPHFLEFLLWRRKKSNKVPPCFKNMTARAQKLFRKILDPDPERRIQLVEINKYIEDRWIRKGGKPIVEVRGGLGDHQSQLTIGSFQSVHSNAVEKNRMLYTLLQHGVETTVDRSQKTHRIINWIKQGAERIEHTSPIMQNYPDEYIPEESYAQEIIEDDLEILDAEHTAGKLLG